MDLRDSKQALLMGKKKPTKKPNKQKQERRVTSAFGTCLLPVVSKWNPVLFLLIHL